MQTALIYSVLGSIFTLLALFLFHFYLVSRNLKKDYGELIRQKSNFETISKRANDIILTIDLVTGNIYSANISASEMLSYSIADLCKKTIHDLHPSELLELSSKTIAEVWDKKGLVYQNLPFVTSKGEILEVESSAKVLVYNDKPVIIVYSRDIRERLRLEREVQEKNRLIEAKNKSITDSINYAKRIQYAIFGNIKQINSFFEDSFVFFKPHSIVSGDFYWFHQYKQYKIVIAADCTGHGVPGAFMTLLGSNFLEEIVDNQKIIMPDKILAELNNRVSARLNKEVTKQQVRDGMDMAILTFDEDNKKVYYSGANNPLCIVKNQSLEVIKATNQAIGGILEEKTYQLHQFDMMPGTSFYIYSDGFQDQFGGKEHRKFLSRHFRSLLLEISPYNSHEQYNMLEEILISWKGSLEQTDDVLVIGIRI